MPVILRPDDSGRWLNPNKPPSQIQELLCPFAAELMESWPVGKLGNKKNNFPECFDSAV
jgi:putative SOS response-associated peptidase YedK